MYKATLIFKAITNTDRLPGTATRSGGWTESWYNDGTFDQVKNKIAILDGLASTRANLLPTGFSISGYRIGAVIPPGPPGPFQAATQAFRFIWPGRNSTPCDIPKMALQLDLNGVGVPNERAWLMRGLPDLNVRQGELYQPDDSLKNAINEFFRKLSEDLWRFKGKSMTVPPIAIQTIDAQGLVTTVEPHGLVVGNKVRIVRGTSSTKQKPLRGSFTVKTAPSATTMTLNVAAAQPSTGGTMMLDIIVYPVVEATTSTIGLVTTRQVGRPSDQFSGRRRRR